MRVKKRNPLSARHQFSTDPVLRLTDYQLEIRDMVAGQIDSGFYKLESQSCCICRTSDDELISERERYGLKNSTVLCKSCGLLRTDPVLRQQDYADFYFNSYRSLYLEEKYATEEFFESQKRGGQNIAAFLNTVITLPKESLVLDVGCGAGGMVQAFVDNGYQGIGIDYDENYLQRGRQNNLDLREGNIFSFQNAEKPSLVIYSHVLEHVHDPNVELQEVRTQLRDDGYLYVELPGIKRDLRALYRADLIRFFHIAHIHHFTLTTLTNLLQRNGFELVGGNENIQSVWKKGDVQQSIDSDYHPVRNFLVQTEKYRHLLAIRAFVKLRGLQATSIFLKKLGLYSTARSVFRKVRGK